MKKSLLNNLIKLSLKKNQVWLLNMPVSGYVFLDFFETAIASFNGVIVFYDVFISNRLKWVKLN